MILLLMGNYLNESNSTHHDCQHDCKHITLTSKEIKYNQQMDGLMKYPKGVTIDQVDQEFIELFDSRHECEEFLFKVKDWGALLRLARHG